MLDFGGLDHARAAATRRQRARGRRTRRGRNASSPLRCDGGRLVLLRAAVASILLLSRATRPEHAPPRPALAAASRLPGRAGPPLRGPAAAKAAKAFCEGCCLAPASLALPPPSPRACCGCWPSGRHSNNLSREGPQGSARASAGCGVPPAAVRRGQPSSRAVPPSL